MRSSGVVTGLLLLTAAGTAHAASVPVGFKDQQIAEGLTSPASLSALPDGRLLVAQQNGVIKVVKDDKMLDDPFWEVPNVDSTFERGCLGIVPDPGFEQNHYVYLYCSIIDGDESSNRVLRVTEKDGHADASSVRELLRLPPIDSIFHMGGAMRFGIDGMLYVAVGNHEDDPEKDSNSQKLESPFGKLLRIRPDGSIPSDNPFADRSGAYKAIWSYGYRNPFAFDIQPDTGRTLVGDVGQGSWEEIDDNKRGGNYGWPATEGPTDDAKYESPLYAYKHTDGHCAITGGAFYNPKAVQFPNEYVGSYFFVEFCVGTLEVLDPESATTRVFGTGLGFPVNLVVSPDGSIYYMSRNQDTMTHDPNVGTLSKISYNGTAAPRISKNPEAQTIVLGEPVTFSVMAQDAESIQWQRDGEDISGATGDKYTIEHTTAEDDGARFVAVAKNDHGKTSSLAAKLTVTTNHPPKVEIKGSSERIEYAPGEMLTLTGSATDDEDGDLPKSAYTWQVNYQHDAHTHPLLGATSGSDSLSFMVPEFEAEEADTWVRAELFVKDSAGASQSVFRDVYPRTQLSSLTPLDPVANGSGPVERDRSNGGEGTDGQGIVIDGLAFNTGLGVHAPSDVRFALDGRCSGKLVTATGIDDEVGDRGSVVFQIFLDDKMAYDSGLKRGSDDRENVVLDIAGVKQLRLVVNDGGDGNEGDHADWGAARVTGCSGMSTDAKPEATPAADSGEKASTGVAAVSSKGAAPSSSPVVSPSAGSSAGEHDKQSAIDGGDKVASKSNASLSTVEPKNIDAGMPSSSEETSSDSAGGCSVTLQASHSAGWSAWLALIGPAAVLPWRRRRRLARHAQRCCSPRRALHDQ